MAKDWLDKGKDVAQILAVVGVPLAIAFFGWKYEQASKVDAVRRDYVQLAVQILNSPEKTDQGKTMKQWASRVLEANSPVKFSPAEAAAFRDESWWPVKTVEVKVLVPTKCIAKLPDRPAVASIDELASKPRGEAVEAIAVGYAFLWAYAAELEAVAAPCVEGQAGR